MYFVLEIKNSLSKLYYALVALCRFFLFGSPLTLIVISVYLNRANFAHNDTISMLYLASIPAYYIVIAVILTFLLFPLYYIPRFNYLLIIPKSLLEIYLIINFFTFNIYRFHIDFFFVDMLINDFNGFGISAKLMLSTVFLVCFIFLINALIFKKAKQTKGIKYKGLYLFFVFFLFLVFIQGQLISIWAKGFGQIHITKYNAYFPLYYPTTSSAMIRSIKANYKWLIPNTKEGETGNFNETMSNNVSFFKYPKKALTFKKTSKDYNILFFILESWRFDMMNKEVTPNIYSLSKKSLVFKNHFSGGIVTNYGLYSLMHGLYPTYMDIAQSNPQEYQSLLIKELKKQNYDIGAYTSSNLSRFSLKDMFFYNIEKTKYHYFSAFGLSKDNDRKLISEVATTLKDTKKKWFKFLFLTSSHYNYNYPKEHQIFKPFEADSNSFLLNKNTNALPILNDYKNSLHYIDSLFGELLVSLKKNNLDKKTIILITSDHGEEFNDNKQGYWGHGSNFTRYQASVPLVLYLPDNQNGKTISARTSHIDIAGSILKNILNCTNNIEDFSNGKDIFNINNKVKRDLIIKSYKNKAYIFEDNACSVVPLNCYSLDDITKKTEPNYKKIYALKKRENSL